MERVSAAEEIDLLEQAVEGLESKINILRDDLEIVDEEGGDSDFIENQLSDYSDIIDSINDLLDSMREYEKD